MPRNRSTANEENTFAGDLPDGPVTLYDQEGRGLDVFTQTEVTRYRSWGYSDTPPAEHVDETPGTASG